MKTKHTQGEWIVGYGKGLKGPITPTIKNSTHDPNRKYIPVSLNQQTIAIVIQQENDDLSEMNANAKLIAAAPDLLEALISLKNSTLDFNKGLSMALNKAEKAIKKSTE